MCHYVSYIIKYVCKIFDKNISDKKHEKLRNYLFKMKKFNQIVLGKGLFVSIKGHLCLTKRHLANPKGQVKIEFLSSEIVLDTFDSN